MPAKLIVLYPEPTDPEAFEAAYHGEHMPLMRKLMGPDVQLPTYRTFAPAGTDAPFYRVAEISFPGCGRTYGLSAIERAKARSGVIEESINGRNSDRVAVRSGSRSIQLANLKPARLRA